MVRVIRGNLSQGLPWFKHAGMQCTGIALFAIASIFLSNHFGSNTVYHPETVDHFIVHGDALYNSIIDAMYQGQPQYLSHYEIPQSFEVSGNNLQAQIHTDIFYGVVGYSGQRDLGSVDLHIALQSAFQISHYCILTIGSSTVGVYMDRFDRYILFDSHSRGLEGEPCEFGSAVLMEFSRFEDMAFYFREMYSGYQFNLSPIDFSLVDNIQDFTGSYLAMLGDNLPTNYDQSIMHPYQYCSKSSHLVEKDVRTMPSNVQQTSGHNEKRNENGNIISFINEGNSSHNAEKTLYFNNISMSENDQNIHNQIHNVYNLSMSENDQNIDNQIHIRLSANNIETTPLRGFNKFNKSASLKRHLNDHGYCSMKENSYKAVKRQKRKYKQPNKNQACLNSSLEGVSLLAHDNSEIYLDSDDMSSVAHYVTVQISPEMSNRMTSNFGSVFEKAREQFINHISALPAYKCKECCSFLFLDQVHVNGSVFNENSLLCSACERARKNKKLSLYSHNGNKLNPGTIPRCLKGLTIMEKRLISRIQVFMTVIVLPGGQYAEKGLAIDFPVNITKVNNVFPTAYSDCNIFTVCQGNEDCIKPTHIIRRSKVNEALKWLQENNICYKDVTVSNFKIMSQNDTCSITNETCALDDIEEISTVPVEYSDPAVELNHLISGKQPRIRLPKCDNDPVFAYDMETGEECAFPHLFPLGKNGYLENRNLKISMGKYFLCRLKYFDGRFRKDISYLLHAINQYERSRLLNEIGVHMRMRKMSNDKQINITAGDLRNITVNPDLIENSYMFMKNIRGTAAYWKNTLLNLLAAFKSLGPPTLFITLSANDMHWPELIMSLKSCNYDEALKVGNAAKFVRTDPYLTAIHFERRFKALHKFILNGPLQPLGKIRYFFGRKEFQNRGSVHLHLFYWIENVSCISASNSESLLNYIDQTICTQLPDKSKDSELHELVSKLQVHRHTEYCRKRHGCRFGFPYRVCNKTHLLTNVNLSSSGKPSKFYETERKEGDAFINAYNPTILRFWKANMDIQLVGSAESAAYYVCAYLCKSEPEDLKYSLASLIREMHEAANLSQRQKLLKLGCCVLKTRRLGAQEAAYRLSDLTLIHSNIEIVFLNAKPPEKRYRVLKSRKERDLLKDNSTDVFESNLLDYYRARPESMLSLCFYEFAMWYKKCNDEKTGSVRANPRVRLCDKFRNVVMRKRNKPAVIRTPKFSSNSDDYFYSLLLLLLPHSKEQELLKSTDNTRFENAMTAFCVKKDSLVLDSIGSCTLTDEIESAIRYIRCSQSELAASVVPCTFDTEEIMDIPANISFPSDQNVTYDQESNAQISQSYHDEQFLHSLSVNSISEEDLNKRLSCLTSSQKRVFDVIQKHYCSKEYKTKAFHVFISGGAGTGKSFLTQCIIEWLKITTAEFSGNEPVVVCAPTGTAAKNIKGVTLHNALLLPVQHRHQTTDYLKISSKIIQKVRKKYISTHTLIIDEVSMVSAKTLNYVHRRLCEIKNSDKYFGGMNIIAVGDFLQLRPVKGKYAFEEPLLWHKFHPLFLTENMRQKGDLIYTSLLNRARVGLLNKADIRLLCTRLVKKMPFDISTVTHLFPKNKDVKNHNRQMQKMVPSQAYVVNAVHYYSRSDINPAGEVNSKDIPEDDRDAGGLPASLTVSKGTRIMLIRNIYTAHGLVNGAMGYVERLELDAENQYIHVKFDDSDIGRIFQDRETNAIPIERINQEFYCNGRIIIREQFPLLPCWACTIHKVQGASLKQAVISLGNDVFEKSMAYVALSRVNNLEGLFLKSFSPDKVVAQPKPLVEYERLRSLKNTESD